jgi:hypothetical protein
VKRTLLSEIEFAINDCYFENPSNPDHPELGEWETVRGQLYEERGDKYVYVKKDDFDEILDANSVSIGYEADVSVDLGDEIDLSGVDNVNLSIS